MNKLIKCKFKDKVAKGQHKINGDKEETDCAVAGFKRPPVNS